MEQTFTEASAWGASLPEAFSVALDAYVSSGHMLKIHDALTTILSGRELKFSDMRRYTLGNELEKEIMALLVENRLRMRHSHAWCS